MLGSWVNCRRPTPDSPLHSETPGMIIDRLSILSLKVYHMRLEAGRNPPRRRIAAPAPTAARFWRNNSAI